MRALAAVSRRAWSCRRQVTRSVPFMPSPVYSSRQLSTGGAWKDKFKSTAVTVAAVTTGLAVVVFASSAFIVLAIGGGLVYVFYKASQPLRHSSIGSIIADKVSRRYPAASLHRNFPSKGGLMFLGPLLSGLFSHVAAAVGQSARHLSHIRKHVNDKMKTDLNWKTTLGPYASVSDCRKLEESIVNGRGRIVAEFPVRNAAVDGAIVRAEGTIAESNQVKIVKLEVWVGGRRIEHFKSKGRTGPIIDAEYHDIS